MGCGRKESGLGTERERAADRRGVGWGQKVSGMGTEGMWAGDGKGVEWGWKGNGWGEWKACEGEEYFILM